MAQDDRQAEIREALGSPGLRRARGAKNRISLRDHVVEAEIGAFQQERGRTQRLRFNLVVDLPPSETLVEDDVDRILSYDVLTEAIAAELAAERVNLLETLAERIAARVLRAPMAEQVILRIEKLDRVSGALGIEILRHKGDMARLVRATGTTPARVVWLAPGIVHAPQLPALLARIADETPACVIAVGADPGLLPGAADPAVRRRIALLGMGQMALTVAARLPEVAVVESRTELDWAMARHQMVVLAPDKIVRDAVTRPLPEEAEKGPALAAWLAALTGAPRLLTVGAPSPPVEPGIAVDALEGPDMPAAPENAGRRQTDACPGDGNS